MRIFSSRFLLNHKQASKSGVFQLGLTTIETFNKMQNLKTRNYKKKSKWLAIRLWMILLKSTKLSASSRNSALSKLSRRNYRLNKFSFTITMLKSTKLKKSFKNSALKHPSLNSKLKKFCAMREMKKPKDLLRARTPMLKT